MTKIMIVTHRSEAVDVLEALQQAGVVQVLDAEKAMVTKEWPELQVEARRPRDLEEMVSRLKEAVSFLKGHVGEEAGTSMFSPRVTVEKNKYAEVVGGKEALDLLERAEALELRLEHLATDAENAAGRLDCLLPWSTMETPVEAFRQLTSASAFAGLLPHQHFDETKETLAKLGAATQQIGTAGNMHACIVACLRDVAGDVQKVLRSSDFEAVNFECMTGRVTDLIAACREKIAEIEQARAEAGKQAAEMAKKRLTLQILHDHYQNLLNREVTRTNSPTTENVVLLEGWVKRKDLKGLKHLIAGFPASDLSEIKLAEGELPPVEIENGAAVAPFETITRLYGTPATTDVDPTAFLAPFFALFFGLCLTDAGYGIVLVVLLAWMLKKVQGDKKALWMLVVCSVMTIIAGAITGGWFADTIQTLLPQTEGSIGAILDGWRHKLMLFDPMEQPLVFIGISLALGYTQVLFGLGIAFVNLLRQKNYAAAVFEKLTWLILLNCLLLFALAKNGILPAALAPVFGIVATIQVVLIFWFTERHSGLAGRIGGGSFAVFSTVFYLGDMLSYVRIMALGMVTAGLGMAINILTALLMDIPYVGFILGLLLFVGGHMVNIALSLLSAFVHSLRLQFVEFFPKFFAGGGREFKPLRNDYQHVLVVDGQKPSANR
ncbi:MAG: V-type ATP synthase subunit I [Phycisphaerae bacterium]|nr:V-type ATP synthase subunit I [Phycisphaerae bacterium]